MLKRTKLVIVVVAVVAIVPVNALPAFAQGQAECGSGANVSRFTLKDIEEGNPKGGGEFSTFAAQNIEPNFGQALKPGATKCAQN